MSVSGTPRDIARRMSGKIVGQRDAWRRESFTLPRAEARDRAREWFDRFPKAAYMTEIEFWRELDDGRIEFVIRRLRSAD
jgi:hypothetical protein